MQQTLRQLALCLALAVTTTTSYTQQPDFISRELDQYIQTGMEQWQVPGLAIVVVKNGKVVVMKGYGVRDIATRQPVDEHTHFFIASNSKLFTGLALANLEVQGKLKLNDPIRKYFPEFRLYDSLSTQLVSIRDMLSHRIGTRTFQGDFTFWNTNLSRQEIMQRMQLLKPSGTFRQDYGYCNSCFMTAGEIIPKVTGLSWETYVQDSILQRLGMLESQAASNGIESRSNNIAVPYTTSYTGQLRTVPYDRWDNLGPAASIVSNVSDLSKWLLFQLDSGRLNGQRVMPWPALQRTRMIQTVTGSIKSAAFPINFRGYGLGLVINDYNGRQIYYHTGGAAGMVSNVCFVPDEQLGIAILTNNDNQNFFEALRYQLLDAYLGVPGTNRSAQMLPSFKKEMSDQLQEIEGWRSRIKGNQPPRPLADYAGEYTHALYGSIWVKAKGNALEISFEHHPTMSATLRYMDKDEWLLEYSNIEYGIFSTTFSAREGKVFSLQLPVNPFVEMDTYTFLRK